MSASPLVLPPVRLLPPDELARLALAVPLLDHALRLTRWAAPHCAVDAFGDLSDEQLHAATAELGLPDDEDGLAATALAWDVAVDTGLLVLDIPGEGRPDGTAAGAGGEPAVAEAPDGVAQERTGRALPGEAYTRVGKGDPEPREILALWLSAAESALADAAVLDFGPPDADMDMDDEDGDAAGGADSAGVSDVGERPDADREAADEAAAWEAESEFLDTALVNLYALTAMGGGEPVDGRAVPSAAGGPAGGQGGPGGAEAGAIPLPVLAASLVVPDEMDQPSDAVLEQVTDVMLRLDDHFRLLAPAGLLDYRPVDEALIEEDAEPADADSAEGVAGAVAGAGAGAAGAGPAGLDPEEVSRYGVVRLTPLGLYGMRGRLTDAGAHAPVLGELAAGPAAALLDAVAGYPDHAARAEAEVWLAGRRPLDAARELLAAARGDDPGAPGRRLMCQQTLALLGAESEPALREVLDDRQLGGLARVWLSERGAADVPPPGADMVFWLTVDTLAAQLAADDDPELLAELVRDLVARHDGFFDAVWRVEHPATADVLDAMGRLHPDRRVAKEARKAAFKARSRQAAS
jgi:hypothetical protein